MFYQLLSTFYQLVSTFYQLVINCLSTGHQLLSTLSTLSTFFNNFLSTVYQLFKNILSFFLSTFCQLCISYMSTFHQHVTNFLLLSLKMSKSFLFIDSLLFCMNLPGAVGQDIVVVNVSSLNLLWVRPPSQLLGRSCCYWELVPLGQGHFLQ